MLMKCLRNIKITDRNTANCDDGALFGFSIYARINKKRCMGIGRYHAPVFEKVSIHDMLTWSHWK